MIPATVTSIGSNLFEGCSELYAVYFLGDRPTMYADSIPPGATIYFMPGTSGWVSGTAIETIDDSRGGSTVTYAIIEGHAMAVSCTQSVEGRVTVISSIGGCPVDSIGPSAFAGAHDIGRTDILSVTIEDGISTIRERAFYYCYGLESIIVPTSVTSIMDEAFRADTSLGGISIPDATEYIGFEAFRDCSSLAFISVPDSVTFMGEGAFYLCKSATDAIVGKGLAVIPARAFGYSYALESIRINGAVTAIGDSAFYMCGSLRFIVLPDSVLSLGANSFYECSSLATMSLGTALVSIGEGCFQNCSMIEAVTLPASLESVGSKAFAYCSALSDVYFKGRMPTFGASVFLNDVAKIHCTESNKDSWSGYDGIVVDKDGKDAPLMAFVIVMLLASAVAIICAIRRRCFLQATSYHLR